MLKVLFDYSGFEESYGGVVRYQTELIRNLPVDVMAKISLAATPHKTLQQPPFSFPAAKQTVADFMPGVKFPGKRRLYLQLAQIFPNKYPSAELSNRRLFERLLADGDFDVLHLTGPHRYSSGWQRVAGKKAITVTVHDLVPELFWHDKRVWLERKEVLSAADFVIAVSENTKRDLIELYGVPSKKISVVYHGIGTQEFMSCLKSDKQSKLGKEEYLLYVGKRGGYKNYDWFEHAVQPWLRKKSGRKILTADGCLSDAELVQLYAGAFAYVCPSHYEGFGMPVLEAMTVGCPAVLARTASLPEIGGSAARYFESENADELLLRLNELEDVETRTTQIEAGLKRAAEFSWTKCANETVKVWQTAVTAHNAK